MRASLPILEFWNVFVLFYYSKAWELFLHASDNCYSSWYLFLTFLKTSFKFHFIKTHDNYASYLKIVQLFVISEPYVFGYRIRCICKKNMFEFIFWIPFILLVTFQSIIIWFRQNKVVFEFLYMNILYECTYVTKNLSCHFFIKVTNNYTAICLLKNK